MGALRPEAERRPDYDQRRHGDPDDAGNGNDQDARRQQRNGLGHGRRGVATDANQRRDKQQARDKRATACSQPWAPPPSARLRRRRRTANAAATHKRRWRRPVCETGFPHPRPFPAGHPHAGSSVIAQAQGGLDNIWREDCPACRLHHASFGPALERFTRRSRNIDLLQFWHKRVLPYSKITLPTGHAHRLRIDGWTQLAIKRPEALRQRCFVARPRFAPKSNRCSSIAKMPTGRSLTPNPFPSSSPCRPANAASMC
jgi:hypothetical protein